MCSCAFCVCGLLYASVFLQACRVDQRVGEGGMFGIFTAEQSTILDVVESLLGHRYYSVRVRRDPTSMTLLRGQLAEGILRRMQPVFPHRAG